MKLLETKQQQSMAERQTIRMTGTIEWKNKSVNEVWVEIPAEKAALLSPTGDCWLILLVLLGVLEGEDVEMQLPVDPLLFRGVSAAAKVWKKWNSKLHVPAIEAPLGLGDQENADGLTASFFSGGVDSLYTALRHSGAYDRSSGAFFRSDLLIRNYHREELSRIGEDDWRIRTLGDFASKFDKEFLPISSNIMFASERLNDQWANLTHGPALAFLGHAVGARLSRLLIASTFTFEDFMPWGSSPLTDPLFTSSRMQFIHDGAHTNRFEKTEYISLFSDALKILSVCDHVSYDEAGAHNCSRCPKCLRTMTALDLIGRKAEASSFDWEHYTSESLGEIFIKSASERAFTKELCIAAAERQRTDVVRALERGERRSKSYRWIERAVDRLRQKEVVLRYKPALKRARSSLYKNLGLRRSM